MKEIFSYIEKCIPKLGVDYLAFLFYEYFGQSASVEGRFFDQQQSWLQIRENRGVTITV